MYKIQMNTNSEMTLSEFSKKLLSHFMVTSFISLLLLTLIKGVFWVTHAPTSTNLTFIMLNLFGAFISSTWKRTIVSQKISAQ